MTKPRSAGSLSIICLAVVFSALAAAAATSEPAKPKPVDTTVRVSSVPPGAFVRFSAGAEFSEVYAVPMGKTPLLRLMPLPESGGSVQITKAGYQVWQGRVSQASAEIKAELIPLTDAQKQEMGWFVSPPVRELTVVPVRLGIKKVGNTKPGFDVSTDAESFTNRFLGTFESTIHRRFGGQVTLAAPTNLASEAFWQELTPQVEGMNVTTIGFTPVPRRLNFSTEMNEALAALGGAVLLVRAEASYMSGGAVFARVAIPILLTAGSAAGGYAGAQSTGSPVFTYSVFGASPSSDMILVQLFLVHSQTRELMWYGQLMMPQYFKHQQVTEKVASQAAEQVPAAFLGKQ